MQVVKLGTIIISNIELYPDLEDTDFITKLSNYEEFNIPRPVYSPNTEHELEELANKLCNNKIELAPYQLFVRNFLSNETPYNGLLLYHGLGTGKTCSAITISEEYRMYLKQTGKRKHLYILGGENIRSNYKKQLFHSSHLTENHGIWTCTSCVGNKFLEEIDPLGISKLTRESIETQIYAIIRNEYIFMGYKEFANRLIEKITDKDRILTTNIEERKRKIIDMFENCMIVIDEVHNIKNHDTDKDVLISPSRCLDMITTYTTIKLVLLSATPMFNICSEIIWLSNLLNRNDKRDVLQVSKIFKNGDFVNADAKEQLISHIRGYISFVKGENPFTFPYRIYPESPHVPKFQLNDEPVAPMLTKVYPVIISDYQFEKYKKLISENDFEFSTISMKLCNPILQVLNMAFPGGSIKNCMTKLDSKYVYSPGVEKCFSMPLLQKYSGKIHSICSHIEKSVGIILIYTQFIEQGIMPMALALESMGFARYEGASFMDTKKTGLKYSLLTGDHELSPTVIKERDITASNSDANKDGSQIKVIIITQSASEGVDLKNVRQIHIMDPWWHMNRIEQIIGRGIRLCSHKKLPFRQRNAEIYLYTSMYNSTELIDSYMYRFSEEKALKVGKVTRLLKENAIDCFMNHEIPVHPIIIKQELSTLKNGKIEEILYKIGDRPYSVLCDYMESCEYNCNSKKGDRVIKSTNINYLIPQIKDVFKQGYVFNKHHLLREIGKRSQVSIEQIYLALSQIIDQKEPIYDMLHRKGRLINRGDDYMFQPHSLSENIMPYERRIPVQKTTQTIVIHAEKPVHAQDVQLLIENLTANFIIATKSGFNVVHLIRGETNWYKCVNASIRSIQKLFTLHASPLDIETVKRCVVARLLEMLIFSDCLKVLNYVYTVDRPTEFDKLAMDYFISSEVIRYDFKLICLWDYDKTNVGRYVAYEDSWKPFYVEVLATDIKYKLLERSDYGAIVGGIVTTRNNDTLRIVKTKDMAIKSYGTNILKGKVDVVNEIASIMPDPPYYTKENQNGHSTLQVICEEELVLRLLDKIKYKSKRWFLYPYECILNANNDLINFNR